VRYFTSLKHEVFLAQKEYEGENVKSCNEKKIGLLFHSWKLTSCDV